MQERRGALGAASRRSSEVRPQCPSRRAELRLFWRLLPAQWSTEGRLPAEMKERKKRRKKKGEIRK